MMRGTPGPTGPAYGTYFRFPPVQEFRGLRMLVPPTCEPLTVDEVNRQCRIDVEDEDESVSAWIAASREYCETAMRRVIRPQTWVLSRDQWPRDNRIQIPLGPVLSVLSVTYQDTSGTVRTMTEGSDYFVDLIPRQAEIVLPYSHIWPPVVLNTASPIQVTFRAGYPYRSSTVAVSGVDVTLQSGDEFDSSIEGYPFRMDTDTVVVDSVTSPTALTISANPLALSGTQSFQYDGVPARIKQAMQMLCAHFYENREAVVVGRTAQISVPLQLGVDALLSSEAVYRF